KNSRNLPMAHTTTGTLVGTPHFMSPEQLLSAQGAGVHSDLWSVAVVAYVALTGKLPFEGETIGALCIAINAGSFEPVTRWRHDLPDGLDAWFERALHRDPNARFPSAQSLAQELELASFGRTSLSSVRPLPSPGPSVAVAASKPSAETSFDASVTHGEERKQHGVLAFFTVVLTSAFFSALTTVLVLAPDSVRRLGAGRGALKPAIHANSSSSSEALAPTKPAAAARPSASSQEPEI